MAARSSAGAFGSGAHRRLEPRRRPSRDGHETVGGRLRPGHRFGTPGQPRMPGWSILRPAGRPGAPRSHDRGDARTLDRSRRPAPRGAHLPRGGRPAGDLGRTWDELMRTIIDRATAAADAEVCSLYLVDRDGTGLTLAATNGLDREQIGVARLPMGVGITGRAAATAGPIVSLDVRRDPRFAWIRASTRRGSPRCARCRWSGTTQVVGVLNVQTVRRRVFRAADVRFLETLAGAARRDRREGPAPARGRGPGRRACAPSTRPGPAWSRS